MTGSVLFDHGRVAVVTLRRPERRNALDGEMISGIKAALDQAARDQTSRCILLQGEGDHFCAGADFAEVASGVDEGRAYGGVFEDLLHGIETNRLPVIAKVRGAALGAGAQILAACDLSIAAEDAVIGIPSARLGLLLDLEKIQRMVVVLGAAAARDMLLTGRRWSGAEAAERGLVTKAVPGGQLEDAARSLSQEVADAAPLSVQGTKAAIRSILDFRALDRAGNPDVFAAHDIRALSALQSDDLKEGLAASRERREPRFRGA